MISRLMKDLTKQDCPVVLSITSTVTEIETETVIQRNAIPADERRMASDIYLRAREIYFRARRPRPVRAASIF